MRYKILDGFRGFFLLFMGLFHINTITDVTLGKLNHHNFGWVEDAQGFVFISGLVVGLVYGRTMIKKSYTVMRSAIWARARTIFSHQFGLIVFFLALGLILHWFGSSPTVLKPYVEEPVVFSLASMGLITGSIHMGILPMYIWFMLITPFILLAMHKGLMVPLTVTMILVWLYAQTSIGEDSFLLLGRLFEAMGFPIKLGIFFNIFGWQVLFFTGLYAGLRLAQETLDLSFLKEKQYYYVFLICLGAFVVLGLLDRTIFDDLISPAFSEKFLLNVDRGDLSSLYVVAFYVDLFLIVWLLVAGVESSNVYIQKVALGIKWIFSRNALVFLGQHSLHVFTYHILLVYALDIALEGRQISEAFGTLILVLGTASLYLAAWGHSLTQKRSK